MATQEGDLIRPRQNTATGAASNNPVLRSGEIGFEIDTGTYGFGDGETAWNDLPNKFTPSGSGSWDGNATGLIIRSLTSLFFDIDNNGDSTNASLRVTKDGLATELFRIDEDGKVTFNDSFSLPLADGNANQVLKTDGNGNLTFQNESGSGNTILNGTVDPTTEGNDGDFYINTTSEEIFGPKTAGVWGSGTSLVGPQGDTGPTGPQGSGVAWNGEFNKMFTFDNTTGLLNQTTTGNCVFVSEANDTFINGGVNFRIEDFDCHSDASNAINVIYGDFNAASTTTIASSWVTNLPAIPSGRTRLILGVCVKTGNNDFKLYSRYFNLSQRSNYYPFDKDISDNQRDGNLKVVTDIQKIKLAIDNPDNLYTNGRLNRIRPISMRNGGLFRWQMDDFEGNSIGFIASENITLQSGVQTITLEQELVSGSTLGVTLELTMDFDLFDGTTTYSYSTDWYLDDSILLEAIDRWNEIKTADFESANNSVLTNTAKRKLVDQTDTEIACFGDSIWTFNTSASDNDNPENLPPSCQTKYMMWNLYNDAVKNKPVYDRWDSTGNSFTESGTFTTGDPHGAFTQKRGGEQLRYSSTSSAYVEWNWNLSEHANLNFIMSTDDGNANNLTVTVSTGTGDVEVYDVGTTSWVEANSYTFDQIADVANTSTGDLGYTFNDRLKFRRVATSGTPTIRIAKGANADTLYYWGTERYNGATVYFNNEGYSANSLILLEQKYNSSLFSKYKNPGIILFEPPLINDGFSNTTDFKNQYQDFIWGDRAGNLNSDSLKNRSSDWTTFSLILAFPPKPHLFYDTNGGIDVGSINAVKKWESLLDLVLEKGDVPYMLMDNAVQKESSLRGINLFDLTLGFSGNEKHFYSMTFDDVHMNDYGCRQISKLISPNFMI